MATATATGPSAPPAERARDLSIDVLRGIAIFGVPVLHANLPFFPHGVNMYVVNAGYFHFAVPVFIVLSALFMVRSLLRKPEPYGSFVARRLGRLFIPFFVYSLMYFLLTADFKSLSPGSVITKYFIGTGWTGQYFFIVLFQLIPLYPLLARRKTPLWLVIASFCIALAGYPASQWAMAHSGVLSKIGDRLFVYWLPYVFLGSYLAHHYAGWREKMASVDSRLALALVFGIPLIIFAHRHREAAYLAPVVLIAAFPLVPLSIAAFRNFQPKWLAYLGQNSLVIFCLNPLFVLLINRSQIFAQTATTLSPEARGIATLILAAVITAACAAIGAGMKKIGLKSLAE